MTKDVNEMPTTNDNNNINNIENTININSNKPQTVDLEQNDNSQGMDCNKKIDPINELMIENKSLSNDTIEMDSSLNIDDETIIDMFDKLLEEINDYINEINNDPEFAQENQSEFNYDEEFKQLDELDQIDELINEKYYELIGHLDYYGDMLREWNSGSFNIFLNLNETKENIEQIKEIISASQEFLENDAITIRNEIDQYLLEFDVVYENALIEITQKNDTWTEYLLTARKNDILYKKEVLYIEFERYVWFVDSFKEYLEIHKIRKWSYLWSKSNCFFN